MVKSVAKRRCNLEELLKKGYARVYDQCSQEVQDKLKATKDLETVQREQLLRNLITRIKKICVGFDNHTQLDFNLAQSLKTFFLYTQLEKDLVEEYRRNFRGLWDIVEAFGELQGIHTGLVEAELAGKNIAGADATQD
jgi:hypothetical protein